MNLIDTKINMFVLVEKEELNINDDGTSRYILNNGKAILFIEFSEKHTNMLKGIKCKESVVFIQGDYSILKNKKEIPFAKIDVTRIIAYKKENVLKIGKLRDEVIKDLKKLEFKEIQEKYRNIGLTEVLEEIYINMRNKKIKNREGKFKIKWYDKKNNLDFVLLDVNKIEINKEIYSQGNIKIELNKVYGQEYKNYVLVKQIDNNRYELIMGIKAYFRAKILNGVVYAHITDLDRNEFINKINLLEEDKKYQTES